MNVTFDRVEMRENAWLQEERALVIKWTYKFPGSRNSDRGFRFIEGVNLSTGLTTDQGARCGAPGSVGDSSRYECAKEREHGTWVPGAMGLPGAFGAGPFWNDTLTNGVFSISLNHPFHPNITSSSTTSNLSEASIRFTPTTPPIGEGPCLVGRPGIPSDTSVLGLKRFTGGFQEFTLCEGLPVPAKFIALNGAEFRLQETHLEGDEVDVSGAAGPRLDRDSPLVPMVSRSAPFVVQHPEYDTPFPVKQAHHVAVNRSDMYADFMQENPDALLASTQLFDSGRGRAALNTSEFDQFTRRLTAIEPGGSTAQVKIEKTIRENHVPGMQDSNTYELQEESTPDWSGPVPTPESTADRQASLASTVQLGEELTMQSPPERTGLWGWTWSPPWFNGGFDDRADGQTAIAMFKDPTIPENAGVVSYIPYSIAVDGPTGSLLHVVANRTNLPVE